MQSKHLNNSRFRNEFMKKQVLASQLQDFKAENVAVIRELALSVKTEPEVKNRVMFKFVNT